MKTKKAIELAGSASALSGLLKITRGAISQWGEDVPDARIWQLKSMRPDWFIDALIPVQAETSDGVERRTGPVDRRNAKAD